MTKKATATTDKKKAMESKYDPIKLRKMCEDNVPAHEAKIALGLSSMQSLRQHLMRLSVEDQALRSLPGLYERSSTQVRITKHGLKLSLGKLKLAGIDFPLQTELRVEHDEASGQIILTKTTGTDTSLAEGDTTTSAEALIKDAPREVKML